MGVPDSLWAVVAVSWLCLQAQVLHSQEFHLVCNSSDAKALLDLMSNFESPVDGWALDASSNCCDWPGVVCNSSSILGLSDGSSGSGRVVELDLASKKLGGNLSDSVGKLDQLRFLNLSHNLLACTLPESLLHLPNLQVLDLSYNEFWETVPRSANLPWLRVFDISENSFNGSLPVWICAKSTRLQVLNLAVGNSGCMGIMVCAHAGNHTPPFVGITAKRQLPFGT